MPQDEVKDHIPSGLTCTVSPMSAIPRKNIRYNRADLGDPDKQIFYVLLSSPPPVDDAVDNTSHCHILQTSVHECLCTAFIMCDTFKIICERARLKSQFVSYSRRLNLAPVRAVFAVWANCL